MSANDKRTVLFLCTENSARSQMAEGLLRHVAGDQFEVYSAGLSPKGIHPLTHRVMNEIGIDTSGQSSKDVEMYLGKVSLNHVIFVCDKAERDCPHVFPFTTNRHFWPIEDPKRDDISQHEQLERFRKVRDSLQRKISTWVTEIEREKAYKQ